jgi:transcriptional accessory protein Tex/SPT6
MVAHVIFKVARVARLAVLGAFLEEALAGARDIIAERVSDDKDARARLRAVFQKDAVVSSKVMPGKENDPEAAKFKDYFEWSEPLARAPPHRVLALRRGEKEMFLGFVTFFKVEAIAIGNGTAGRETEAFVRSIGLPPALTIEMVNESGATSYTASDVAREENPDHDLTVRGAVSIGRRLMDPLAELVKLDPKSIGVGQYQHDVDQTALKRSLDDTVGSAVNGVGVELKSIWRETGLPSRCAASPRLARNPVPAQRAVYAPAPATPGPGTRRVREPPLRGARPRHSPATGLVTR